MKIKRNRYVFFALDICLAILLIPLWLMLLSLLKGWRLIKRDNSDQGALLHVSSSSSVGQVIKKFGSLEFLFNYDGNATEDVFERNIMFWFGAEETAIKIFEPNWIIVQYRASNSPFHVLMYLHSIFKIAIFSIKYNVQAVRAWGPYQPGLMAWLIAAILGIPFCVSIHADYQKREQLSGDIIPRYWGSLLLAEKLERFVYRRAVFICPIRESLVSGLLKKGIAENKIRIFPHGIDLSKFSPGSRSDYIYEKYGLARNKKILSMVGRLEKDNYVYDYLEIARELFQFRDDWVMCLAGDGRERSQLYELINKYNLSKQVLLLGYLPQDDVILLRKNSAVNLCLMAGFSLLEACASGRPVITYDVEWHYEIIHNDKTGCIIPEHALSKAVEGIIFLFDHPSTADRLGAAAKKVVFDRFDRIKNGEIKKKVYQELVG